MWFYSVGKLEGLNWGGAGSESRPPILGLPRRPASTTAAKLPSGRDPGSTGRTGRQNRQNGSAATRKACFGGTVIFTDLLEPWIVGAWWREWGAGERKQRGSKGRAKCLASVHS